MQWADVTTPPSSRTLRQFGLLCFVFCAALAASRAFHGDPAWRVLALIGAGTLAALVGFARPSAIRFLYTGWMILAFPVGWAVSRLVLAVLFAALFTPVALFFRVIRRDALRRRRQMRVDTYWVAKPVASAVHDYFRQF